MISSIFIMNPKHLRTSQNVLLKRYSPLVRKFFIEEA